MKGPAALDVAGPFFYSGIRLHYTLNLSYIVCKLILNPEKSLVTSDVNSIFSLRIYICNLRFYIRSLQIYICSLVFKFTYGVRQVYSVCRISLNRM